MSDLLVCRDVCVVLVHDLFKFHGSRFIPKTAIIYYGVVTIKKNHKIIVMLGKDKILFIDCDMKLLYCVDHSLHIVDTPTGVLIHNDHLHILFSQDNECINLGQLMRDKGIGNIRLFTWELERLIWIAFAKHENDETCLLGKLVKDVIKYMLLFLR